MQVKIIAVEKLTSKKDARTWFKTFLKLTSSDGRTAIVEEWLTGDTGAKAFALTRNNQEPVVFLEMGYDDNFKKSILGISEIEAFDNEVIL